MGLWKFIKTFFEESEEELKEEIKEADKIKKEAEKRLKELQKRRKIPKKPLDKKLIRNWIIAIGIILLMIFGVWGIQKYRSIPKPFKYVCKETNPCEDCLVTASCVMFEEAVDSSYVHFTLTNQNDVKGDCVAQILIEKEDSILTDKSYKLGTLKADQSKVFKIPVELPGGVSETSVTPSCEWG
ncbi:MAG: hypothetical protein ABIC04_08720 [Nanoarchaeota archaeon]